jgi:hypothetical protein
MLWNVPNRSRRAFLGLAGGAVAGLTFAVPTRAGQEDPPSARKRGGTLAMLVEPEPTTLVTVTNSADPSMLVSAKVTEGLLAYGFGLDPRPQLATHWSVSGDGLQLTFRLREGVRWHDGTAFTANDVAYSIGLLKEFHPRGRTTFANVIAVRTPDPNTAIIELSRPTPFLLHALAACESPIVPRHVYIGSRRSSIVDGWRHDLARTLGRRYGEKERPERFDRIVPSWAANKASELNDFCVCTTWDIKGKMLFLLNVLRKRFEYPQPQARGTRAAELVPCRCRSDRRRSSGTQLIQELIVEGLICGYQVQARMRQNHSAPCADRINRERLCFSKSRCRTGEFSKFYRQQAEGHQRL